MVYLKNLRDNNVNLLKFQHEDLTLQKLTLLLIKQKNNEL